MGLGRSKYALHEACSAGNLKKVVELLEDGEDCNEKDEDGWTPLHFAASKGHDSVIEALFGAGAEIDTREKVLKRTALHLAALNGHIGAVTFLVRHGADPDAQDGESLTALHKAVTLGFEDVVRVLLELGADANDVPPDGTSVLHLAAWRGYLGIVKQLLAAGAKPDRVDLNGHSPLHEAARQGHSDVAGELLKAGAAPELQDAEGFTPAALARKAGHMELAAELAQQIRNANKEGWWTKFAEQRGFGTSVPAVLPQPLPASTTFARSQYPRVEAPAARPQPAERPRRRYGLPDADDFYGDWAPTEEVEDGEGGWGATEEIEPQQSLMERVQGMLGHLVSMLPLPGAAAPAGKAAPDAAATKVQETAQADLRKQEQDLQVQLASKQAVADKLASRGQESSLPSAPRLSPAVRARVKAQEVEIAALKQQLEALQLASRVAETAERPAVAATPQCQTYSFDELYRATDGFAESGKLGYGRHSVVYRGTLNGTPVAIKWLDPQAVKLGPDFQQQASELASLRHPNILQLLGACPDNGCLVYEYSPNGSLEDSLRARRPPGRAGPMRVPWATRTRLAAEVANALHYLHTQRPEGMLHRGVRPSNILLDDEGAARLGDVGLPTLLQEAVPAGRYMASGRPRGALAHTDPAVLRGHPYGPKAEVYALGVTLLQLLTGMEASGLVEHVEAAVQAGRLTDVVDPCAGEWDLENASALARLALRCVAWREEERPDLARDVLPELSRLAGAAEALAARPSPASAVSNKPPAMLLCPITQDVFKDPVIAADGHTYERSAIQQWLDLGHRTSPMTNEVFAHTELMPNWALRSAAVEWREASAASKASTSAAPTRTSTASNINEPSLPASASSSTGQAGGLATSSAPGRVSGRVSSFDRQDVGVEAPLRLPDWAQPGYVAGVGQAPAMDTAASLPNRVAEVDQGTSVGAGTDVAPEGLDVGRMDADVEGGGMNGREEVGSVSEMDYETGEVEEPVHLDVGSMGGDVEMPNAPEGFDDTELMNWPRAPSHRIASRREQDRVPAFA
eukprot:jgi/Botrbrau1/8781/Bobra.0330s0013.1